MNGIIVVDKPSGYTSRDVVNVLSKKFHTKKIGHAGTLDPMATGVLVIAFGKYTKLLEILTGLEKEYEFECVFGISTDTYDIEGKVLEDKKVTLSKDDIKKAIDNFPVTYMQEVPKYSAVKINGKKLYEYARLGEDVPLPKREVHIDSFNYINSYDKDNHTYLKADVKVSKGTYIRSLIVDLANMLDTSSCMTSLRRISQGKFSIDTSYTLDDILNDKYELVTLSTALADIPKREVTSDEELIIRNGGLIKDSFDIVLYTYCDKELAIYKRYEKDLKYLKPWKML